MPNAPLIIRAASLVQGLVLAVDGFPSHQQTLSTRIGGEALEDGREATDHAVATQPVVKLSGIVSDIRGGSRPAAAFAAMERIQVETEPIRVITEWRVYPEMLIRRVEANSSGRGMRFEMELQAILRVGGAEAGGPPPSAMTGAAAGRSGEANRGRAQLGPASDE